jgi:hypothetical protein
MATVKRGQTGSSSLSKLFDAGPVLPVYTVVQLTGTMAATANANRVIVVSNGNAGARCIAVSDGTNWKVVALGATVAAA